MGGRDTSRIPCRGAGACIFTCGTRALHVRAALRCLLCGNRIAKALEPFAAANHIGLPVFRQFVFLHTRVHDELREPCPATRTDVRTTLDFLQRALLLFWHRCWLCVDRRPILYDMGGGSADCGSCGACACASI